MGRKLVIKIFKLRKKSCDNISKVIVVGYSTNKVNGGYIEKLGVYSSSYLKLSSDLDTRVICSINTRRLVYWLNKGARLNSRVSWLVGLLAKND